MKPFLNLIALRVFVQLNKSKIQLKNAAINIVYFLLPLKIIGFLWDVFALARIMHLRRKEPEVVNILIDNTTFKMFLENGSHQTPGYINTSLGNDIYEETMIYCLSNILHSSKSITFFDIGSYISYYALFVSAFTNDKAIVYSIESNPKYLNISEKSKKANKFKNMFNLNTILSDKKDYYIVHNLTVVKEDHIKKYQTEKLIYDENEKKELNDILKNGKIKESTTLDFFCSERNLKPNILNIDVHGAEGLVLNGAKKILQDSVEYILLEVHQQQLLDLFSKGAKKVEILRLLNSLGFDNYLISPFRYNKKNSDYKTYKLTKKLKYLKLTEDNLNEVLFDRNQLDIFVLAIKKHKSISDLKCF